MCMSGPPSSCRLISSPVTISTIRGLAIAIADIPRTITVKSANTGV